MPSWIELYTPGDSALLVLARSYRDQALAARDQTLADVAPALSHIARTDNPHGTTDALVSYTPPGAGAVARTVQARLRDAVTPADYGALANDAATLIPAVGPILVENPGGIPFSAPIAATTVEVRADGLRVTRPVNPVLAPTGGATGTVPITRQVDQLDYFDRGDVLDVTGASFDAPGLAAGYYRISASTVGTRPRANITSGTLSVFGGAAVRTQMFVADWGEIWTRRWTIVSNAATWGAWVPAAFLPRMDNGDAAITGSFDFNALTTSGIYRRNNGAGTASNPPASTLGNFAGVVLVFANDAANYVIQWAFPSGDTLSYQRTLSGGTWTAWAPLASFELRGALLNAFDSTFKPPGIWGFQPDGQGNIGGTFPSSAAALKTGLLFTMYRGGGAQRENMYPQGLPFAFTRTNAGSGQTWTAWSSLVHGWIENGDDRAAASFDFNTLIRPGSYWRDDGPGTVSNGPTGVAFQGTVEIIANTDGSYCVQRAVEWSDTTRFYQRVRTNGTWGAWRTFTGA